jgi:protein LTV1
MGFRLGSGPDLLAAVQVLAMVSSRPRELHTQTRSRRDKHDEANADAQARRQEKKTRQQTFGDERRRQINTHKRMVAGGKAADLSVGVGRGVVSLS